MMNISDNIPLLSCEQTYLLPNSQQCHFVQTQCADNPGFINSFTIYYCISQSESVRNWIAIPLMIVLLVIFFSCIGLVAGNCLVPNLNAVATHLNIPDNVSGLTLLAFANGSPDIISTYTSFATGHISLAFGEIIGAAYFVNSVIIGVIFIINPFDLIPGEHIQHHHEAINTITATTNNTDNNDSPENILLKLNAKGTYLRDVAFFAVSTSVLLYCIKDGILSRFEMLILVTIYILYVAIIIIWEIYSKQRLAEIRLDNQARNLYSIDTEPLPFDESIELHDSYNYNPQVIRNLEFETILNGLTSQRLYRFNLDNTGIYRDNINDDTTEVNETGEIVPNTMNEPNSFINGIFIDYITLPFVKLFKHTIPIMTVSDYEGDYKPALVQLCELVTSLLISPFVIICALYPHSSLIFRILMVLPIMCLTYFSYHSLIRSPNPSTFLKCTISLLGVAASVSWISIIASEIISILTLISSITHIRPSALGITVFALGNSVGDLVSCIVITRMGYPLMALAACIGGPLLNMLLGVGMSGLLVGIDSIEIPASASIIFCLLGLLFNLVVILLVFIPIGGWRCDKYVGSIMIFLWMMGVFVAILLEFLLTY